MLGAWVAMWLSWAAQLPGLAGQAGLASLVGLAVQLAWAAQASRLAWPGRADWPALSQAAWPGWLGRLLAEPSDPGQPRIRARSFVLRVTSASSSSAGLAHACYHVQF